jgi:Fungal specific transcription factor domain
VGNLIRLAVDLGLHRNPNEERLFSPKECQLRMRLWFICLEHDRNASILSGRPLAIQRADFNTPAPSLYLTGPGREPVPLFSENFDLNIALGHIQAEVVNSLHRPGKLSGKQVVRRAIEVERSLEHWRITAPRHYQELFVGHSHWGIDQRRKLLTSRVTPECGITLLKYGVLRMSVLRRIFNNNDVSTHLRYKTLHDGVLNDISPISSSLSVLLHPFTAVIAAHNVLVIHAQLATYPEATFFVSPMPIYIASMIILLAVLSRVETLAWGLSKEDIQLSLKLYSLFRWRWPRHQDTGLNLLITRIAKKYYGYKFPMETGPCLPPILLDEMYWLTPEALRSKVPPSLENVWDLPVPARTPEPMQTGIGVETHEHRPHLPLAVSLEQQHDRFAAATAQSPFTEYAIASMINIDTSGGAEHGILPQHDMVRSVVNRLLDYLPS